MPSIVQKTNFMICTTDYKKLIEEHGYAESMDKLSFFNKLGEMCEKGDDNIYVDIVDLVFCCPNITFVAVKCGTNTNISRDKISSNNKRATKKGCMQWEDYIM